ncbi:MAG: THUMP domain-containing protein [Nitrosopumilus sp.]|nr:THUMP domain-containing protein [Nitrosopumilus sp.]
MNLIITCARHLEPETEQEIRNVLEEMGDSEPIITISKMSGILTAETALHPIEIIEKIRDKLIDEPWSIRYCLRLIPIQKITETEIDNIVKEIADMSNLILTDETYRISIKKRNSDVSSQEIISRIAKNIKNKVSLEFPDKVVLVEIIGDQTGLAIIKKSDILSVEKTKRSISE